MKRTRLSKNGSKPRSSRMRVVDVGAKIESERKKLQSIVNSIRNEEDANSNLRAKTYRAMESKTKAFEDRISSIKKPYLVKIAAIEKKGHMIDSRKWKADYNLRNVAFTVKGKAAMRKRQFEDAESFKGFMLLNGVHVDEIDFIKKKLPNNIQLFRHYDGMSATDALAVGYFAVYNGKLVGFHFTHKAEHAGDYPEYHSWFGVSKLSYKNMIGVKRDEWSDFTTRTTFTEWKNAISKTNPAKLKSINLADKDNRKALASDYSLSLEGGV